MSRNLTSAVQAAFEASNVAMLVLVELDFESATQYLNNSGQIVTWNGHDWRGVGAMGAIEAVEETAGVQATTLTMKLSGVETGQISIMLSENYQGRSAKIYAAALDADYSVLADPVLIFQGLMDQMQLDIGQKSEITLTVESRLADLERPRVRRFNDADQQEQYPGDKGLAFAEQMVSKAINWGNGPAPSGMWGAVIRAIP